MKKNLNETAKRNILKMKEYEKGNVHFAAKIGISTGKASQLTGSDTTISSTIMNLICECYKISETDLFSKQWKPVHPDNILQDKYYGYFFTTWAKTKPKIDIAEILIKDEHRIDFKINSKKEFDGVITVSDNFITADIHRLSHRNHYQAFFIMPRDPNIKHPKKYYGGLGFLILPTDSELVPVVQRIMLSCVPLCIEDGHEDNEFVRKNLFLEHDNHKSKVEVSDDKEVFYYLRGKLNSRT
ncbi:MAG: hypothetical protein FWG70_11115 [Oscillospiraceae bacterium]|nr:hypothetical protein [Oscillospiraceae bacterium]